ncbi:MAG: PA2169 family four-helix-bundle protein [Alphaproteobacteria bacterium]|nr:PA2169 family four-helix-bundle protein [Alphaproteobacteria bacterium]
MSDNTEALNEIISFLKAGEEFYRDGAEQSDNAMLKNTFTDMATVRNAAIQELSAKVENLGEEPSNASWVEQARNFYTTMKSALVDADEAYIADLEEHEDRTLEKIENSLSDIEGADVASLLVRHLGAFKATHDKMKSLKEAYVN